MYNFLIELFNMVTLVVGEITQGIFDGIISLISQERKTRYDADFGRVSDMLFKSEKGFAVTGSRFLSLEDSFSHVVCFGGSGSRKSNSIIIPTVLNAKNVSMVIHDPSKEVFFKTALAKSREGFKIKVLDYNTPEKSEGFNALAQCKTYSDVYKLASVLVRNTIEHSSDPFWNKSAETLIALFATYLIKYAKPEHQNFYNVLALVQKFSYDPKKLDVLMVRTHDQQLIDQYKTLVAYPDKTLMSVVATAITAMSIFLSESLARVTSFNTIEFEDFRKHPTILYICNSAKDAEFYRGMSSIFFESFWGSILNTIPSKNEFPILFLIDEASSMKIGSLASSVALLRKHAAAILLIYQDYRQLENLYGSYQASNIVANCATKIYMPNQPIEICKMLETVLGKYQYEDEKVLRTRELLTASEIRQLNESIILFKNNAPLRAKMRPYYETMRFKRLTELGPYQVQNKIPFSSLPVIQFD